VFVLAGRPEALVFAADGQRIARWGALLEAARLPPTMVVGVHGLHGETQRIHEYSPVFDRERFTAHERFFVSDVRGWVRSRFAVSVARNGQLYSVSPRAVNSPLPWGFVIQTYTVACWEYLPVLVFSRRAASPLGSRALTLRRAPASLSSSATRTGGQKHYGMPGPGQ
jgi:hypothetical protein